MSSAQVTTEISFSLPDPKIDGVGTFHPPVLTREVFNAIRARAEQQVDRQVRDDMFRLIAAVESKQQIEG